MATMKTTTDQGWPIVNPSVLFTPTGQFVFGSIAFGGIAYTEFGHRVCTPALTVGAATTGIIQIKAASDLYSDSYGTTYASVGWLMSRFVTAGRLDIRMTAPELHIDSAVAVPTYFMPPTIVRYPERWQGWPGNEIKRQGLRPKLWYRSGVGQDVTLNGITYYGGRWNGPLTGAEITALSNAGYASRLYASAEPGLLPAGID